MFTSMAEGLGGRLTERATLALLVPAAVFWGGGLAALYWHGNAGLWGWGLASLVTDQPERLQDQVPRLFKLSSFEQFLAVVGVVVTSAFAVDRFVLPTLRWAEGYLPDWLGGLRRTLVKRQHRRITRDKRKLEELAVRFDSLLSDPLLYRDLSSYRTLDRRLEVRTPSGELMPTDLGNILRAAETRPLDKYGLDVLVCWPRLWLLLPESATKDLTAARASLDASVRTCLWGLLFLVWSVWAWWAVPAGVATVLLAYRSAMAAAGTYGSLVESAFDVYRLDLYKKAGWSEPPKSIAEQIEWGKKLTKYFWRRSQAPSATVAAPVAANRIDGPAPAPADGRDESAPGDGRTRSPSVPTKETAI